MGPRRQAEGPAVDAERQVPAELRRHAAHVGVLLPLVDRLVAVGVHDAQLLERGDLGHVDDVADGDGARLETESGVTVDREVAERVRVRDRRAEGEAEGDRHAPHGPSHSATRATPSSAASVVRATAAWRRSKYGLMIPRLASSERGFAMLAARSF